MLRRFMLPIHKQKRIQRLARLAVDAGHETERETENAGDRRRERAIRSLLATLDQDSLKVLHEVVESRGATQGSCVVVPKRSECKLRSKCATASSVVAMVCRYFRWSDLDVECRLKRLALCRAAEDGCSVCVNPYHWSRVQRQEVSVPVVCAKLRSRLRPPNPAADEPETPEPESVTTGGTCQYGSISSLDGCGCSTWCRLVYFERRRRVGQVGGWSVRAPQQNVFYSLPRGDGLALSSVVGQNPQPEPDVLRTRQHIGKGITLTLEEDGVWLYNRSERPLFVSSPTLDPPDASCAEAVHKVAPGFSLLVYEPRVAALCRRLWQPQARDGPRNMNSVTVSFAKGWGPRYSRRSAAECPCWLELWLCGAAVLADAAA